MEKINSILISKLKKAIYAGDKPSVDNLIELLKKNGKSGSVQNIVEKLFIAKKINNSTGENKDQLRLDNYHSEAELYKIFREKASLNEFDKLKKVIPGISFVTVSMNRHENLIKAIPTWLRTEVDEIIVVDWSSSEDLEKYIDNFNDPRIKLIKIMDEKKWILTHAFNVGLKLACRSKIYKIDSDILLNENFLIENKFEKNEYIRGFWKSAVDAGDAEQKYVNGTFGAFLQNLKNIGYYDERILTYGWDDSDIYARLTNFEGLAGQIIKYGTVFHQDQDQDDRIKYQKLENTNKFLKKFEITERENSKNKFKSYFRDPWTSNNIQFDYQIALEGENRLRGKRIVAEFQSSSEDPESDRFANLFSAREFLGWCSSDFHKVNYKTLRSIAFTKLILTMINAGVEAKFINGLNKCKNIKIIFCDDISLAESVVLTINKIFELQKSIQNPIVLAAVKNYEADYEIGNSLGNQVFTINENLAYELIENYAGKFNEINFFDLVDKNDESMEISRVSFNSVYESCFLLKKEMELNFGDFYSSETTEVYNLVISLYDEGNLYRLRDYLACLLLNMKIFNKIIVHYEYKNSFLLSILKEFQLKGLMRNTSLVLISARPTYSDLFNSAKSKLSKEITVVANADVFFDRSLLFVYYSQMHGVVMAVSRRDILKVDKKYCFKLVKYPNGSPNILSADAWIFQSDTDLPDLNYQLGTIHCDSFFNNKILSKSSLKLINPALDLNVYHLHDERFNSSEEKMISNAQEIEENRRIEQSFNGGINPISGVCWSSISEYNRYPLCRLQRWRPNSLVIKVYQDTHIILVLALAEFISETLANDQNTMVVFDLCEVINKTSIERFLGFINKDNLQIDLQNEKNKSKENIGLKEFSDLYYSNNIINYLKHQFAGISEAMKSIYLDLRGAELDQIQLLKALVTNEDYKTTKILDDYFASIDDNKYEYDFYKPYISDYKKINKYKSFSKAKNPSISFVTSMFNAKNFLPSFLENMHAAVDAANGELIIVDVNDHDEDEIIVQNFLKVNRISNDVFRYVRLNKDPGLYKTWEYAINIARSELISNANVDDKRSPTHSLILSEFLLNNSKYSGACGCIWASEASPFERYTTRVPGELWFSNEVVDVIDFNQLWIKDDGVVKSRNIMHCIPVWRKKLHEKYGFFNELDYGTSADWAFWLKCTQSGELFKHISSAYGRYYVNPNSHNRINDKNGQMELKIIKDYIGVDQEKFFKQ